MDSYFELQALNNAWANARLGNACLSLPKAELEEPRIGFFPTIIETLNHILTVDWFYVSALEGNSIGLAAFDPEVPFREIIELVEKQRTVDQRLIQVCNKENVSDFKRSIRISKGDTVQVERFDRTLLHLFQHQIHHRGQVHSFLSGTSVKPPQLDEFYMEIDTDLRKPELDQLGFTEKGLWKHY